MLHAGGTAVDLVGEGWPNWIMAVTGALTLVAAVAAALFARAAAKHAGEQVKEAAAQTAEAHRQVELSERQESLAQQTLLAQAETAQKQNEAALRVERRSLEARLDERMPFVIARAVLSGDVLWARSPDSEDWYPILDPQSYTQDDAPIFKQRLTLQFKNVSSMPARIDVVHTAHGELRGVPQGTPIIVPPGDTVGVEWSRRLVGSDLARSEPSAQPEVWWFNLQFWVRDLAMLVRDDYNFSGSFTHFEKDGSRLLVRPMTRADWPGGETVAGVLPERHYERLDLPAPPAE